MKKALIWIAAIILTVGISIYQRMTGPTYPLKINTTITNGTYKIQLPRSASIGEGCTVEIPSNNAFDNVSLVYHKYPGNFSSDTLAMKQNDSIWTVNLPVQPPAGKLQYYIVFYNNEKEIYNNSQHAAIIRFKGDVPLGVLIPHILAMFLAMIFALVSLLMAATKIGNFRKMTYFTLGALAIGGFILGPIMQYFAFGEAWTGFPVGKDLTDNKTLIAAIFWIAAIIISWKKPKRWAAIVAAIIMIGIFSIPHSAGGSEFNYETGTVETGINK
jgi:hypothetical protein